MDGARLPTLAGRAGATPSTSPFTQKHLSRRALGHKPMSTVTDNGDGSQNCDPLKHFIEAALHQVTRDGGRYAAKYDDVAITRLLSTAKYFGIDTRNVSNSSSEESAPSLVTSSSRSSGLSKMVGTPQYPPGLSASSKADVSANWRAKNKRYSSSESNDSARKSVSSSPPAPIMTIDELMTKFSSPESNVSLDPLFCDAFRSLTLIPGKGQGHQV